MATETDQFRYETDQKVAPLWNCELTRGSSDSFSIAAQLRLGPGDMGQSIGGEFRRRRRLELVAGGSQGLTDAQRDVLRGDAARVRYSRQLRQKLFGPAMFAETAWDILLTLYLAEGGLPRPGTAELAESTASPLSTTSRWLAYLQEEGLAKESGRSAEAHSSGVELTHKGRVLLDEYFLELREAEITSSSESSAAGPSAK